MRNTPRRKRASPDEVSYAGFALGYRQYYYLNVAMTTDQLTLSPRLNVNVSRRWRDRGRGIARAALPGQHLAGTLFLVQDDRQPRRRIRGFRLIDGKIELEISVSAICHSPL